MSKVQPVPRLRTQLSQRSIAGVVCMSALKRETKSSIEPRSTGSGDLPLHCSRPCSRSLSGRVQSTMRDPFGPPPPSPPPSDRSVSAVRSFFSTHKCNDLCR
eukprot:766194-Prorocentrum_minimum.AAC.1